MPTGVLIVGAGAGNNAAAALRHGGRASGLRRNRPAKSTALGQRIHPEQPYSDPARANDRE